VTGVMSGALWTLLWYALAVLAAAGLVLCFPWGIRYDMTETHFVVRFLGIPFRRVAFTNLERVTTHHVRWAEHWWNTWRPFRRRLMLVRRRGPIRNFVVTPMYRYEVKARLEKAIRAAQPSSSPVPADAPDESPDDP
jgi:hypothetical protein